MRRIAMQIDLVDPFISPHVSNNRPFVTLLNIAKVAFTYSLRTLRVHLLFHWCFGLGYSSLLVFVCELGPPRGRYASPSEVVRPRNTTEHAHALVERSSPLVLPEAVNVIAFKRDAGFCNKHVRSPIKRVPLTEVRSTIDHWCGS